MAPLLSLLAALVALGFGPRGALGCDLRLNHVLVSRENLLLLEQMRRVSPVLCLQDREDLAFPREALGGRPGPKAVAVAVAAELLRQSSALLLTAQASAAWDTSLLGALRSGLHRQLHDLDACLQQQSGPAGAALGSEGPTLRVRSYFHRLRRHLRRTQHSACAWERVREGLVRAFVSSATLHQGLSSPGGHVGPPAERPH